MNELKGTAQNVHRIVRVKPMANHVIVPRPQGFFSGGPALKLLYEVQEPMWKSLFRNVRDALFPEKLPPLRLTSRPVVVRDIWARGHRKRATMGSLTIHALMIGGIVVLTIMSAHKPATVKPEEHVTLLAPPLTDYQPVM